MVVKGNILFLDLKVNDYIAHIAVGRYFVLMKKNNMKLTSSGGQNRGIHRETKPHSERASSLSLTNL